MKSFSRFAVAASLCVALPSFADDSFIRELSLIADTNAVIEVASGTETVIERLSGARGTITKTGGGKLRILKVDNSKVLSP